MITQHSQKANCKQCGGFLKRVSQYVEAVPHPPETMVAGEIIRRWECVKCGDYEIEDHEDPSDYEDHEN